MTGYFSLGKLWASREGKYHRKHQEEAVLIEQAKAILKVFGKFSDFDVNDIPQDELREKFAIIEKSRQRRKPDFSIVQDRNNNVCKFSSNLIRREVMKW